MAGGVHPATVLRGHCADVQALCVLGGNHLFTGCAAIRLPCLCVCTHVCLPCAQRVCVRAPLGVASPPSA